MYRELCYQGSIQVLKSRPYELEWRQPHPLSRFFELLAAEDMVGQLEFSTAFGSRAAAATAETQWVFRRGGFFLPVATAHAAGEQPELANYRPGYFGNKGKLTLRGGEELLLSSSGVFNTHWRLTTPGGRLLAGFQPKGIIRQGCRVSMPLGGSGRPDLLLLVMFSWYLVVLNSEDAATAVIISG